MVGDNEIPSSRENAKGHTGNGSKTAQRFASVLMKIFFRKVALSDAG